MHLSYAGNECRERTDDWNELGIDDRFAAVSFIEFVSPVQILTPEDLGIPLNNE